jgi:hypothetical protein
MLVAPECHTQNALSAAHRRVSRADDQHFFTTRRLCYRFNDGSLVMPARLSPTDGVVMLLALRAACGDIEPTGVMTTGRLGSQPPGPGPIVPTGPACAPARNSPALTATSPASTKLAATSCLVQSIVISM